MQIPNGIAATEATAATDVGIAGVAQGNNKFCGRYLAGATAALLDGTVCCKLDTL